MTTDNHECVRRRRNSDGSVLRPRKITVRATEQVSNRFASIQGLIFKYGEKETIADLFETVMLPALERYVEPYVDRARMEREANNATR